MSRKVLAIAMITLAVIALVTIARYPTEPSWNADDPRRGAHVTAMAWWQDGLTLAHQDGTVWQRQQNDWHPMPSLPDDARSTVLLGGDNLLAGTSAGVMQLSGDNWNALTADNAPTGRISHLAELEGHVYVAGTTGVWERDAEGNWRALGRPADDAPVYRVLVTLENGEPLLRSGSIEAGVHIYRPGDDTWVADTDGLPEDTKVLSFHQLPDNTVLAGTNQGMFHQQTVTGEWARIGGLIGQRRVLTMAHTDERLYAGSDDGVWRAPMANGGIAEQPDWLPVPAREGALDAPVAWIIADDDTPWIAAGSAYKLRSGRTPEWYMLVIGAPLLLIAGGGLLLNQRRSG